MGIGGGAPKTPFPEAIQEFVVRLPLPTVPPIGREPVSEFRCVFEKENERAYQAAPYAPPQEEQQRFIGGGGVVEEWIYAAEYRAKTPFGSIRVGLVVNAMSAKVTMAVTQIVIAVAKSYAIPFAYRNQRPPLPLPSNTGIGSPLSRESVETLDGTARFRGFCSGLRSLDPDLVDTVEVYVPLVFAKPGGGPPPSN